MFPSNLKYLREKFNMDQTELAERLGRKSTSSISEWEKGKYTPKAGILADIAHIFHVDLDELMNTDLSQETNNTPHKNAKTLHTVSKSPIIDQTIAIMSDLNSMYQKRVYSYAKEQYENQSLAYPETLAAHQADTNHIIDNGEAKKISDYLDDAIDKHNEGNR